MVIIEDFLTEQEADLFKNFHIDNFNKLTDVQKIDDIGSKKLK